MKYKIRAKEKSVWKSVVYGALVSLAMTIGLCALSAKIIVMNGIPEEWSNWACLTALLASAIAGAGFAGAKGTEKRVIACYGSGGFFFLLLLLMATILFRGGYRGIGAEAFVIWGGCTIAVLPWKGKGRGRHIQRRFTNG